MKRKGGELNFKNGDGEQTKREIPRKKKRKTKRDSLGNELQSQSFSIEKKKLEANGGKWNFDVDYNDHFETPRVAYEDIVPLLNSICKATGQTSKELLIYDPYWCKGTMIEILSGLGFPGAINQNRDFYRDLQRGNVPAHDCLITNPPYSGEHKTKLLEFLRANHTKPFALLLPAYTATKSYWREFSEQLSREGSECFFLLPPDSYRYTHPEGTGKEAPPFYSAWFIGRAPSTARDTLLKSNRCSISGSVLELEKRGIVKLKRPNPKRRKKMSKNLS